MLVKSTGTFCARRLWASRSPSGLAGLDHRSVDADVLDSRAAERHRLMAQAADDELEQSADVVVGLADEDPCHSPKDRRFRAGIRPAGGMKRV